MMKAKIENQDSYKLNIEHKEGFHFAKKAIIDQVNALPVREEQREDLCRFMDTLIEPTETDTFVKQKVIDHVSGLLISAEEKEELQRLVNSLIELTEVDAFFAGFKACAELVGETKN